MKLFEVAGNVIAEEGIARYFGLMGDGNMSLITYLSGQLGVPFVSARHEAGAIGMADGYARASGNVAVCTVTQGPGLTNTMTALVTARKARSPMVLFAGDVAKVQAGWPQDTDQDAFFAAAGIPVIHLTGTRTVLDDVRTAFRMAREGSTPVAVDCPIDSQQEEWNPWDADIDEPDGDAENDAGSSAQAGTGAQAAAADIGRAARLLSQARRPLIVAGRGAVRAGAAAELLALGERVGALLATTLAAKGLFEGQPFDLGIVGSLGSNLAVALAGRADVVLAVGASLNDFTTLKGTLFSEAATIIRCDLRDDPSPNRYHEDLLLTGDARAVSGQLLEVIPASTAEVGTAEAAQDTAHVGFRTPEIAQSLRDFDAATEFTDNSEQGRMDPRTLTVMLDALLPGDRQVVTDVGHFFGFPATYLRTGSGGRYMAAVEFGAVGSGLGVAIGAALARPELTTVLFVGDGGLMMSLPDLNTAARIRANLVIVVVNDGAYGSELQMLRNWKLPESAAILENPDISALGGALGLRTFSVRSAADLHTLEGEVSASEGPVLIDCHVTQSVVAGWLEGAFIH